MNTNKSKKKRNKYKSKSFVIIPAFVYTARIGKILTIIPRGKSSKLGASSSQWPERGGVASIQSADPALGGGGRSKRVQDQSQRSPTSLSVSSDNITHKNPYKYTHTHTHTHNMARVCKCVGVSVCSRLTLLQSIQSLTDNPSLSLFLSLH